MSMSEYQWMFKACSVLFQVYETNNIINCFHLYSLDGVTWNKWLTKDVFDGISRRFIDQHSTMWWNSIHSNSNVYLTQVCSINMNWMNTIMKMKTARNLCWHATFVNEMALNWNEYICIDVGVLEMNLHKKESEFQKYDKSNTLFIIQLL